jgi:hypothetical protein
MTEQTDRLTAALAAEHVAIFAYARLGVLLDSATQKTARTAESSHHNRRDALLNTLAELRIDPPAAQAGYALPFPVTDQPSALRLAALVEDGVAATYRVALKVTEGELRRRLLDAYSESAVLATRWRRLGGQQPLTTPFPGRPA